MKTEFRNLYANKVCNACHKVIGINDWYEQIGYFIRCDQCIELKKEQINSILAEGNTNLNINNELKKQ